jgi:hypothetical protein
MATKRQITREAPTSAGNLPTLAGQPQAAGPAIPVEPPYWLAVREDRVEVVGGRVVCQPVQVRVAAGCNGIEVKRDGSVLAGNMRTNLEARGFTLIPWDIDGPGSSYLRQINNHGGWISRFETVYPRSDRRKTDEAGYGEWLEALSARGAIPAPADYAVSALRDRVASLLESYLRRRDGEAGERSAEPLRAKLKVIDAWLASSVREDEPPAATSAGQAPRVTS